MVKNWIVDQSTARDFTVGIIENNSIILYGRYAFSSGGYKENTNTCSKAKFK